MAKAAIEIPDDYLAGLRRCADTEKGDLSAFVIQAMLENYEAAKEDRRAMCGDTGLPRWYVKIGNEAQHRGRPGRAGGGAAPRHRARHARRAAAAQPRASALAHRPQQQCRHRRAGDRIRVPSRRRLDRAHHRAQGRPVRHRLPHAVSRRRHRGHQAVLSRHADRLRQARACLPAGHRRRRARRLEGHLAWCSASRRPACASSARAIPTPKIAALEEEFKELGNTIGMGAMGFMGSSMVVDCHIEVGYCHTGGMPMSVHMFCLSSRRASARIAADGRAAVPHRSRCGSPTTCGAPPSSGDSPLAEAAE